MIVIGIILSVFAIAFFCWLLFTLAVYALPFFVGLTAGVAAFHHGVSLGGAILIALAVGGATLTLGQIAFAATCAPLLRGAIALLFAVPATVAGYHATLGIAHLCITPGALSQILAGIAALLVGGTAWSRMALFLPPAAGQGAVVDPRPSQLTTTANS